MTTLPLHPSLRIAQLAGVFNHTTNSYKFYWFWSLLDLVAKNNGQDIPMRAILVKMVSLSWHTVAYYKLSLGLQDQLSEVVERALALGELTERSKVEDVEAYLETCWAMPRPSAEINALLQALRKLWTYVPYRFIRPFFGRLPKGNPEKAIAEQAQAVFAVAEEAAPYKINSSHRASKRERTLTLHPAWRTYLQRHYKILQSFCWWHLSLYLQARNPNVPSVGGKIAPPYTLVRDLKKARRFWRRALAAPGDPLRDVFSGVELKISMPIDHFIPWSFVLHDQLWNLAPTSASINSSKGNRLPHRRYWPLFARLHYQAVQRCVQSEAPPVLLEDYALLFKCTVDAVAAHSVTRFTTTLQQHLQPLHQQAVNSGFGAGWTVQT